MRRSIMSVLQTLVDAIRDRSVEVIDLTAPLSAQTPILQLPEPFGNTARFGLTETSHYDERGPAWYWNDIVTGEHTGTHFDAPVHWVTGQDGEDVSQVPPTRLVAPAVVLDFTAEAAADPDFLLEIEHVKLWEAEPGPPAGYRRGRDRGPAAHRQRLRIPVPGAGAGRAFLSMRVAEAVGRELAGLGAGTVFGVVGSGNFHVTNALVAAGARFVAARHEGGAAVMADAWARPR